MEDGRLVGNGDGNDRWWVTAFNAAMACGFCGFVASLGLVGLSRVPSAGRVAQAWVAGSVFVGDWQTGQAHGRDGGMPVVACGQRRLAKILLGRRIIRMSTDGWCAGTWADLFDDCY